MKMSENDENYQNQNRSSPVLPNNEKASEQIVSLQDVLEEQEYLEEAAQCLLGNADDEKCSYDEGYVKRQPLYSCLTCLSNLSTGPAGLCLACSLHCHDGHDCVELYTKRNFRCDCGNSKFGKDKCLLKLEKDCLNELNTYNQNYDGLYCTCHRPYPDTENPEIDDDNPMVQCIICEDWFHTKHAKIDENLDFDEFACIACVSRLPFLLNYSLESKSLSVNDTTVLQAESSSCTEKCSKPELPSNETIGFDKPAYFCAGWRKTLCVCKDCKVNYLQNNCEFLLDEEDTVEYFERKAKSTSDKPEGSNKKTLELDACLKALKKFDHVQQIEMISEYKNMSSELSQFLEKFATSGKIVTESDIYGFFDDLRTRKRIRLDNSD